MKILIRGGRVIDPAQRIDSRLDLLTENGRIAALLPPSSSYADLSVSETHADQIIDADGCIVCPGFLDIHMHEDPVGENGQIEQCIFPAMLRMGVTTVLAGNCGENLCHPLHYLDLVDRAGTAVNVAMMAGHSYFRKKAGVPDKYASASPEQIDAMKEGIMQALDGGCIGISYGLRYVPGATTEEFLKTAVCAAPKKHLVSAHIRNDAAYVFDAAAEFIEAGRLYGIPLQLSHIGSMAGFGQMTKLLQQIDVCRAHGINIAADCYPYYAFSTSIGASTYDEGWLDRYGCDYDAVEMCEGKYKGMRCTKEIFDEMRRDHPEALTVCYVMRSPDIHLAFRHPNVLVGSDGILSKGQGHPRAAGTFPRFLSEFVRNGNEISLYDAITKMTQLPAERMKLQKKGNLQAGSDADITVFDPKTICDRSTFTDPMTAPDGIRCVLIGGRIALKDGRILDNRMGRSVRFSAG